MADRDDMQALLNALSSPGEVRMLLTEAAFTVAYFEHRSAGTGDPRAADAALFPYVPPLATKTLGRRDRPLV